MGRAVLPFTYVLINLFIQLFNNSKVNVTICSLFLRESQNGRAICSPKLHRLHATFCLSTVCTDGTCHSDEMLLMGNAQYGSHWPHRAKMRPVSMRHGMFLLNQFDLKC